MPIQFKETVAVVEDDPVVRASLAALITSIGLECHQSASAEEFLERGPQHSPSCIVLDLCLPGMNGEDLLERLVPRLDAPPVVVVSGFATVPVAVRMMRGGAYTVLEKPCRTQQLKETISAAVAYHLTWQQERREIQTLKDRLDTLSPVELEVAQGIAQGRSNFELAKRLNLGLRTVEKRRQQVFRKLNVDNLPSFIEFLYRAAPELVFPFDNDIEESDEEEMGDSRDSDVYPKESA